MKCAICGNTVPEGRKLYCSNECGKVANLNKLREKRAVKVESVCKVCGKIFMGSYRQTCCSPECSHSIGSGDGLRAKRISYCLICNKPFVHDRANSKYCSKPCYYESKKGKARACSKKKRETKYKDPLGKAKYVPPKAKYGGDVLEREIQECIASGQTYAERKIAKTMAMIPKIEVNV